MSSPISTARFSELYRQSVDEVLARMPADRSAISKHNIGWRQERFDPRQYLLDSERRYLEVMKFLPRTPGTRVLDVGGFLAAFPLTLRKLGYDVSIAEKFGYYDTALDGVASLLGEQGIRVIDADFTGGTDLDGLRGSFDVVTCMAVAEHLAHSPRELIENIHAVLRPGGDFAFEIPNLAYWPRRFSFFFRGNTVLAPIEDLYHSAVPFTGHHREYTIEDARYVIREGKFQIVGEHFFNYGIDTRNPVELLKYAPAFLFKEWAGVILIHARK